MLRRIYLDNNATTFLDPHVLETMIHHLKETEGNPSSVHSYGQHAQAALKKSRRIIADYLKVKPNEIMFTSGGTEGVNFVMRGLFTDGVKGHVVTSSVEHSAVYSTAKHLEKQGCSVSYLEPGLWGAVTPSAVCEAIRGDTRLIVLMAANNETGVKTDIDAIARLAQEARIPFIVDGVALLGKECFCISEGVSAMCFSGHKLHAPKGVGFTYIKSGLKLNPLLTGGEQEFGRRAGTENLIGIVGLSEAILRLGQELPEASLRMQKLRDKLEQSLQKKLPNVIVNGLGPRIVNTTNLSFEGIQGETLLARLDMEGIAVSHGSACSSGALEPSRILLNMGISYKQARTAIRISLSRFTTEEDIDYAIDVIQKIVSDLRKH